MGIYFIDSQTGWLVGGSHIQGGFFLKTTDGGESWKHYLPLPTEPPPKDVYFLSSNHGWIAGGTLRYTSNGGEVW